MCPILPNNNINNNNNNNMVFDEPSAPSLTIHSLIRELVPLFNLESVTLSSSKSDQPVF